MAPFTFWLAGPRGPEDLLPPEIPQSPVQDRPPRSWSAFGQHAAVLRNLGAGRSRARKAAATALRNSLSDGAVTSASTPRAEVARAPRAPERMALCTASSASGGVAAPGPGYGLT